MGSGGSVSFTVGESMIPTYTASTETCGDWSENEAFTADNLTPKNFGCSVQHNIAAMVADPRDLLGPREAGTQVIEEHTEERLGHEEIYLVLRGRARFTIDDNDELDLMRR